MTISEVVRKYRHDQGMTLEKMGEIFGVTKQAVHSWETGKTTPGSDLLISTILNCKDWRRDFALSVMDIHPRYINYERQP